MKHVILIDDDKDIRDVIAFALENEGFEVHPFENGKKCLEELAHQNDMPGLIIVDYLMPEMNGITFINRMRENFPDTFSKVPIAISSAMGPMSPELNSLNGLIHLPKPMNLDDLLKLATEHCS
jgi:two-component system, NtrC family, nitrogen regulation response regulator GlnG